MIANDTILHEPVAQTRSAPPVGKVLVAEDSDILRAVIVHSLEDAGYRVLAAADGQIAWDMMDEETKIDLLITDFKMPGINGIELARRIRTVQPAVPILLISALSREARYEMRAVPGTVQCLEKPFLSIELVAKVREVLDGMHPGAS